MLESSLNAVGLSVFVENVMPHIFDAKYYWSTHSPYEIPIHWIPVAFVIFWYPYRIIYIHTTNSQASTTNEINQVNIEINQFRYSTNINIYNSHIVTQDNKWATIISNIVFKLIESLALIDYAKNNVHRLYALRDYHVMCVIPHNPIYNWCTMCVSLLHTFIITPRPFVVFNQ